jgi:hypothetical protein
MRGMKSYLARSDGEEPVIPSAQREESLIFLVPNPFDQNLTRLSP